MYNAPPHPSVFSWPQAYWCGGVACYAYCSTPEELNVLKDRYNVNAVQLFIDPDELHCRVAKVETPEFTYIGVEGTARALQWASYLNRIHLVERATWPGRYVEFFSYLADSVVALVGGAFGTKRIVVCGHSLGGAVAAILAETLRRTGSKVEALWTFGSPKPGTPEFADSYTIPTFRLVGQNDIVPSLPPDPVYYLYPLAWSESPAYEPTRLRVFRHVGAAIEVGDLDLSEVQSTVIQTAEVSWYRAAEGISGHYMGSYQEAIWVRLTPEQRGVLLPMFDSLLRLDKQGIPNFALDVAAPEEDASLINTASASERDLIEQITGDDGKVTLHLFESPDSIPEGATIATFTECVFPGYAPQTIPTSDIIDLGKSGGTKTSPARVSFTLTEALPVPKEARGVYAVIDDDGPKFLTAYLLPAVKVFAAGNDTLDVLAECQVSRVY